MTQLDNLLTELRILKDESERAIEAGVQRLYYCEMWKTVQGRVLAIVYGRQALRRDMAAVLRPVKETMGIPAVDFDETVWWSNNKSDLNHAEN